MRLFQNLALIDLLRRWLLAASLALVVIPGFVGLDLSFFGFRLGRFQPFKFVFFPWLVCQAVWVFKRVSVQSLRDAPSRKKLLWGFLAVLDLCLAVGLITVGGSTQGWGIYAAILMGQAAALLSVLDDEFPADAMVWGTCSATLVLVFFSVLELVFPKAALTVAFMNLVHDSPGIIYQLGSALTVAALAEYTVRALPLIVLLSHRSRLAAFCSVALVTMGLLTLEKSAGVSWVAIALVLYLSGYGKKYVKRIAAAGAIALILLIAVKGPEQIIARYVGMFRPAEVRDELTLASKKSIGERTALWEAAWISIKDKPLTGVGLGGLYRQRSLFTTPENKNYVWAEHVHNLVLEMGVCGGIFAMFAFVASILVYGRLAWQDRPRRWTALLYFAGQSISILVDARIYVSWLAITLFWFAGMAWTVDVQSSRRRPTV
jgi:hypothetical protein